MSLLDELFGGPVTRHHTVRYGENLAMIAECYYGDPCAATVIYRANLAVLDDPNRVYAGQVLVIPHLPHHRRIGHARNYV